MKVKSVTPFHRIWSRRAQNGFSFLAIDQGTCYNHLGYIFIAHMAIKALYHKGYELPSWPSGHRTMWDKDSQVVYIYAIHYCEFKH